MMILVFGNLNDVVSDHMHPIITGRLDIASLDISKVGNRISTSVYVSF